MSAFPVTLTGAENTLMRAQEYEIEPSALQQLRRMATLSRLKGVRVMPDVHVGKGAVVGSVVALKDAVAPNAVGTDLGCGMIGVRTSLTWDQLPDDLHALRDSIESRIPLGADMHKSVLDLHKWKPVPGLAGPRELGCTLPLQRKNGSGGKQCSLQPGDTAKLRLA